VSWVRSAAAATVSAVVATAAIAAANADTGDRVHVDARVAEVVAPVTNSAPRLALPPVTEHPVDPVLMTAGRPRGSTQVVQVVRLVVHRADRPPFGHPCPPRSPRPC